MGRVTIAVSTDGASPALARELRNVIDELLTDDIAELAEELAAERAAIKARVTRPRASTGPLGSEAASQRRSPAVASLRDRERTDGPNSSMVGRVGVGRRPGGRVCTPSSGVTDRTRTSLPATVATVRDPSSAPSASLPVSVDGSTPITEPDVTGLPSISEPDPAIPIGELDNGLRYLIRDNDNPGGRVEMRLAVDAGSVLEDDTQDGGAHFLEHMLFNGTEQFPENELIAVLRGFGAGFGADINAYTSYDETVYQLTMPTADDTVVDTGLDVLEQWLSAATIDQAQVEAERGVVLDEWRGSESSSDGRIFATLEELFLAGSAYEDRDPIGTDTSIEAMDAEPLRRFYDDWYRPDNASVIVVGDIDPDVIEQGIIDRFAGLTACGTPPNVRTSRSTSGRRRRCSCSPTPMWPKASRRSRCR